MNNAGLFSILIGGLLVNNFVFYQFLGICPAQGVSERPNPPVSMSLAVIMVMFLSAAVTWPVYTFVLVPCHVTYLQTIIFILIIMVLVLFGEMMLKKYISSLYESLKEYLPMVVTNSAVLGVTLLNISHKYGFLQSLVNAFGAGCGVLLAMVMFAGVRERLERCDVPEGLRGMPITLIAASLVSVSFIGFQGLFGL